ncbi:UDP-N-acetylmuramoyl-L-alanyl-D-glutamate--2,6-diaminopimelate ligase [Halanaerobium hydrogeniformans]|uniref:UDP-N-acetylmuramoyl-L-alanyl-D-glutamate--2,6-diaminopimelate ligase n=1 Tax=Halanaerobium hydrogeniformans TaxID=656519 RepID=E4RIG4_HALHG|nr:UDP-N-acetylmuramoyl-L-alanyl-D-glutamate--2,6-diaminopimelate ligase [Halanaerobium hydrogeniformans]ADQ15034.1 UDP-N-acetylmuramyl-tripeptide synthetase [Halanaerobium hydrogeniformans]
MKLNKILNGIEHKIINGKNDLNISDLQYDSRKIKNNDLFIAIKGFNVDGHDYIKEAVEKGATAVIVEKKLKKYLSGITYIEVENTRKEMAVLAKNFFANPLADIDLIGITGTNGKTTTAYLIYNILRKNSFKTAMFGTIKNIIAGEEISATRTTPESLDLYRYFSQAKTAGVQYIVMEVSSHALDLYRVHQMDFSLAVFTNLSPEHLDYHKDLASYRQAKSKLFSQLSPDASAVINLDDKNSGFMLEKSKAHNFKYSLSNQNADLYCQNYKLKQNSLNYQSQGLIKRNFQLKLGGIFNIYNSLAAVLSVFLLGISADKIVNSLEEIKGVPGRFELINAGQDFQLIVDYAHTPDGMENVLEAAKEITKNRLIVLFGCGGDRDRSKRPVMAKLAEDNADYVFLTNDNPRSEDPEFILSEIKSGFSNSFSNYEVISDRKKAIVEAINFAKKDDIILILGRGHEKYQVIKDKKIELDDRKVAYQALKERSS